MKGKHDNFRGPAIIAFIDILGFSNLVKSNWNKEINDPVNKLLGIRNNIEKVTDNPLSSLLVQETKKKLIEGGVKVITISDSFILLFGLEKTANQIRYLDFVNGFSSILEGLKTIWQDSIEAGFTIRGAITVNEIYWDEKFNIIGPGLIEAYSIESKIAITSRIFVSSTLQKMLHKLLSNLNSDDFTKSVTKKMLKDADGQIIIHPKPLLSNIENLETKILKMASDAKNGGIQLKYISLLANIDSKNQLELSDLNTK
ncbi:hypothetical protein [Sphingobacterium litopenaei]|uniref:Guanylate cyclase domain-containing protein n=1 Tax=Sphingobacterium litopenaei TaxID=2763500 RepID=A0ABR7YHL5_9SPHI|nr:hypothetical protein [Sphingobacterium litopenaei]MBD1430803.1 hypothetical protein [Sphingobacterium litopenaei]